ncbi:MAG: type III-A CRISPR-associated protein Csm2 [Eubacteriales bacterium]
MCDWKKKLSNEAKKVGLIENDYNNSRKSDVKTVEEKQDFIKEAETVIHSIGSEGRYGYKFDITTSKLRNILTLINQIYNEAILQEDKLPESTQDKIKYLKIRIIYEAGRDKKAMKGFVEKAKLLEKIDSIGSSKKRYIEFSRYFEALVAYHRFLGGND